MTKKLVSVLCGLLLPIIVGSAFAQRAPAAPILMLASSGGGSGPPSGNGLLSWEASSGATGYKVYWNNTHKPGPPYDASADVGNVTSASPAGFDSGDPARIRAYDGSLLEGPWSSEINTPACTSTISSGIATAVSSATAGATICLSNGAYGDVSFTSITKSAYVTVRCQNGKTACTMNPDVTSSVYLRFAEMNFTDEVSVDGCSTRIAFFNGDFPGGTPGMQVDGTSCPTTAQNIDIDTIKIGSSDLVLQEGRLSIAGGNAVRIQNSFFGPEGYGDGIMITDSATQDSHNITIGPGNIFDGITQSYCDANGGAHCDMIQVYGEGIDSVTIVGNWFRDGSFVMTHHTSTASGTLFENNLMTNLSQIQVDQSPDFTYNHNTMYDVDNVIAINGGDGGETVTNNINHSGTDIGTGGLTHDRWLCTSAPICTGTNQEIGTPTFDGGSPASISTWAGFKIASGSSFGKGTASDAKDKGTLYFNPAAPANFVEN